MFQRNVANGKEHASLPTGILQCKRSSSEKLLAAIRRPPIGPDFDCGQAVHRLRWCATGPNALTGSGRRGIAKRMKYDPVLHIVLYQPEIPQNTGSVGRTCVAVGSKLWLVRPLGFRIDDYYLRRAGLDYWEHLEWEVVDDWPMLMARLAVDSPGRSPWMFTKTATRPYTSASFGKGDILVFGAESFGLPPTLLETYPSRALRIPIRSDVRSLNLSNSVAIAAFEALRQWA